MEERQLNFREARELASAGLIFTGHTPVAAGHDYFSPSLVERYLGDYAKRLGLSIRDFLGLGRQNPANDTEEFCMTVLALRMAASSNGVSKLHGQVSREMWQGLWPGVPIDEIPSAGRLRSAGGSRAYRERESRRRTGGLACFPPVGIFRAGVVLEPVAGAINLPHSSRTERGLDLIWPESGASCQSHYGPQFTTVRLKVEQDQLVRVIG
jgi:hypothetical protein